MKNSEALKAGATIRNYDGVFWKISNGILYKGWDDFWESHDSAKETIFLELDRPDIIVCYGCAQDWSEVIHNSIQEVIADDS